jgi:hypothetical protein
MIKKKVTSKVKVKSKVKSKTEAKKVTKKSLIKIKNPVYLDFEDEVKIIYAKYQNLYQLLDKFVTIHSNGGILYGFLTTEDAYSVHRLYSYSYIESLGRFGMIRLSKLIYNVRSNFNHLPNRDDLSLIAETDDYLGNELFWNEHDEFKKDSFKKSTDFQFILENVDKIIGNRIYVRRLKQVKSK